MSAPRRHPNVVHSSEVEPLARESGKRMAFRFFPLGSPAGARQLGASLYEIAPGQVPFPCHFHCANEEAMFVLEGRGHVRIGEAKVAVGPGDWISFPVGPDHAHQVENTGDVPLRFLALSTTHTVDVCGYPDSKKILAVGAPHGAKYEDPRWVRKIFEEGSAVDYFKGEQVD